MASKPPTKGWHTFKAHGGSRLMREKGDENRTIQVREGTSGWKKGLTFARFFRYIPPQESHDGRWHNLYTIIVLNKRDGIEAVVTGETDAQVWKNAYEALNHRGLPTNE